MAARLEGLGKSALTGPVGRLQQLAKAGPEPAHTFLRISPRPQAGMGDTPERDKLVTRAG